MTGLCFLSACADGGRPAPDAPNTAPQTQIAVARGQITVAAPAGYCVEPDATQTGWGRSVVVFADCAAVGASKASSPAHQTVLTASIGPAGSGALPPEADHLAKAFAAEAPTEPFSDDHLVGVRVAAAGAGDMVVKPDWRGATVLAQRLVLLTVASPETVDASGAEGKALLRRFADALRKANRDGDSTPETVAPAVRDAEGEQQSSDDSAQDNPTLGKRLAGLFSRK